MIGFVDLLIEPDQSGPRVRLEQLIDLVDHVALEYMIHHLVPRQRSGVYQQLEGKLQTWVHLPATRFPLAFFSAFLELQITKLLFYKL